MLLSILQTNHNSWMNILWVNFLLGKEKGEFFKFFKDMAMKIP